MTGLALRVYHLETQSLWYDEAVTAHVTSQGVAALTRWTAEDIQPPLFYYIVAAWTRLMARATRRVDVALPLRCLRGAHRPVDVGGGAATDGPWRGVAVAWLTALHPLYVYYSQEARMYTQLVFLGVLAGYFLLRAAAPAWRNGERATEAHPPASAAFWAAFAVAAAAMLYTHYFGVFLLTAYALCYAL